MTPSVIMSLPAILLLVLFPASWITMFYVGFLVGFNFFSGLLGVWAVYSLNRLAPHTIHDLPAGHKSFVTRFSDILVIGLLFWTGHYWLMAAQVIYFITLEGLFTMIIETQKNKEKSQP